jgi:tetratricopeptide (TPR) repeat protein
VDNWPLRARIKYWLFLGRRKSEQKRYEEALIYFEGVIRGDPASSFALAQAAFCLNKLRRYDEAINAYERALQGAPQYGDIHAHLAEIFSRLEHDQEAYDSLHRAFRIKPKLQENLGWLQVLRSIYVKLEKWEEARAAFEKISESPKTKEDACVGLGISLGNLDRWQEALDAFQRVTETNANNGTALHGLGWTFAHLNRDFESLAPLSVQFT